MIYAIIFAFVAGLSIGAFGVKDWADGEIAQAAQAQARADAKVKAAAETARREAEDKITDMEAAYIAGESNAKTITKTVYLRGQQNVVTYEVFRNPACVLPAVVLSELNRARAGMLAPADTAVPAAALPVVGASTGRPNGDAVPANAQGHGNAGGVPTAATSAGGSGQVPATSVRPVPKPTPVK